MVQILYYQHTPPTTMANFWWSEERGLTCDNPRLLAWMEKEGIKLHSPQGSRVVFPHDGRAFFDALPFRFTGMERAQQPVIVAEQGGVSL
ncbi:MAG: hypothetical protein KGL39_57610, partial [Patescibacteria group bacterium]|nr:hypothetical protein [Patescibacteria group bacterium]